MYTDDERVKELHRQEAKGWAMLEVLNLIAPALYLWLNADDLIWFDWLWAFVLWMAGPLFGLAMVAGGAIIKFLL